MEQDFLICWGVCTSLITVETGSGVIKNPARLTSERERSSLLIIMGSRCCPWAGWGWFRLIKKWKGEKRAIETDRLVLYEKGKTCLSLLVLSFSLWCICVYRETLWYNEMAFCVSGYLLLVSVMTAVYCCSWFPHFLLLVFFFPSHYIHCQNCYLELYTLSLF